MSHTEQVVSNLFPESNRITFWNIRVNRVNRIPDSLHHVEHSSGPEAITGSTRLKAGTATKLVLNTLTTASMVRLGKVYENLMVDLTPSCDKLRDRSRRILCDIAGIAPTDADAVLDRADGELKTAIVMQKRAVSAETARKLLREHDGAVRSTLEIND